MPVALKEKRSWSSSDNGTIARSLLSDLINVKQLGDDSDNNPTLKSPSATYTESNL